MPITYAIAFAAHHARGSTLRPRDTLLRASETMSHPPTMLRAGVPTTTTTTELKPLADQKSAALVLV